MNDLYEARNSVYCYENSNVLKNKFEIKDEKKLEEIERRVVLIKLFELRQNNQIGKFDIKHIINIHKFYLKIYIILLDFLDVRTLQRAIFVLQSGGI